MSNCVDKQENPDQELDNLKDWKEKQIKFEAKRGRKGRFQRAVEHTRLSGVDFIEDHFGLSDQYDRSDREKILKRVMIMARTQIPPRKISRADFDKWWLDPIIDKDRPAYDDPVKQVAYRQTFNETKSQERVKGKIAGTSVRNLWNVLFWLQKTYPNEEWLEREINTISKLLKQIQDEFNGISLTDFNFEFYNNASLFKRTGQFKRK